MSLSAPRALLGAAAAFVGFVAGSAHTLAPSAAAVAIGAMFCVALWPTRWSPAGYGQALAAAALLTASMLNLPWLFSTGDREYLFRFALQGIGLGAVAFVLVVLLCKVVALLFRSTATLARVAQNGVDAVATHARARGRSQLERRLEEIDRLYSEEKITAAERAAARDAALTNPH